MSVYSPSRAIAYKEQSILTATPGQLVVMLYDGCLRFLHQAAFAMRDGDMAVSGNRLSRAEAIIDELLTTLDLEQGGEIASRLQGIYVFCNRHLLEARTDRDAEKIEKVSELMGELRESWAQVAATA
jgi:flagellar secretion chaperone FliS